MHLLASTIRQIVTDHPEMRTHVLRAGGQKKAKSTGKSDEESLGYTGRCKKSRRAPCTKGFEQYARPTGEGDELEMCCMRLAIKGEEQFQRLQNLRTKEAELSTKLDGYEKLMEDEMFNTPVVITKPNGKSVEYTFTPETLHLKIQSVRAKRDRVVALLGKAMPFTMTRAETREFTTKMNAIKRPEERTDSTLKKIASEIWALFTWKNMKRAIGFLAKVALVIAGLYLCCYGGTLGDLHDNANAVSFGLVDGLGAVAGWVAKKAGSKFDVNDAMQAVINYGIAPFQSMRTTAYDSAVGAVSGMKAIELQTKYAPIDAATVSSHGYNKLSPEHQQELTAKINSITGYSYNNRQQKKWKLKQWNKHKANIKANILSESQAHGESTVASYGGTAKKVGGWAGCGLVIGMAVHWFFYPLGVWAFATPTQEEIEEDELNQEVEDTMDELRWRSGMHGGDATTTPQETDLIDISA